MSEAVSPLPSPATGAGALMAVTAQAAGVLRETQELLRQAIEARGPLIELVACEARLAELEAAYRKGTTFSALADVLGGGPEPAAALEAVSGPEPSPPRRRRPRIPGERPLYPRPAGALIPAGALGALG